ncbi:O-linked N-acetylglucosamine transferase, SPINDLY family protein [Coleofasciculus chthonoplastes]|uniref:O-linked N-acetylglucosamine transferase, SPINDLY family protein n=1 Tax=Coleofasciculus chthonoplastes TaxID=64178 RepID=UPI0032F8F3CB
MSAEDALPNLNSWQPQVRQYLSQGNYSQAISLYEQAIANEPTVKSHYWYLGLILLLQGQEVEAQTTWLIAMAEGEAEQIELWTAELLQVLEAEAQWREELADDSVAWTIRQHLREICPTDINNLLHLIALGIKLKLLTDEDLVELDVIERLKSEQLDGLNSDLLLNTLQQVLDQAFWYPSAPELVEVSLPYIQAPIDLLIILLPASIKLAYSQKCSGLAASFLELYLRLDPNNLEVLRHLSCFYQNAKEYAKGIETAKLCKSCSQTLPDKLYGAYVLLRGLMSAGGYWQEACQVLQEQESLVLTLIKEQPLLPNQATVQRLFNSTYFIPYLRDNATSNRYIQNQIAQLGHINVQNYAKEQTARYHQRIAKQKTKPLKIGYLSHCMRSHSVGWLARWVLKHHDRDRFQTYAYFINYSQLNDILQEWYLNQADFSYKGGSSGLNIAEKIFTDEIDILIDLDSITLDTTCEIMSLKPAPVQVTWLGWDASGIPTIDYFIADPYVLPEAAQEYYQEKIWRLPQTYIAVDGFEVAAPTLRRDHLDIPSDAVVYLCPQRGYKLNLHIGRLQMKILREVPNSYFLIKGQADKESITRFFTQMAEEEGIDGDRLKFLPDVPSEHIHRANLGIADVVLDTYPYNGATTTLETLWMGIPLVTRVGEQFAARNSYTMMINVGVTEGIAWTDEEYVEWGVRLGKDEGLRQKVAWKLRQSRHTSPLWNAEQFTREMEKAYEQMWQRYVDKERD